MYHTSIADAWAEFDGHFRIIYPDDNVDHQRDAFYAGANVVLKMMAEAATELGHEQAKVQIKKTMDEASAFVRNKIETLEAKMNHRFN